MRSRLHAWFFADTPPLPHETRTLRDYLVGMVCQGVWWAGYLLVPFVLAKSLNAPAGLVTLSVTMDTGGMFLALYWGHLLARGGRRHWLFWGGVGGRLVMLLMPLVATAVHFVWLLAAVYFFTALIYPAQNGLFQANFHASRQGRFFGYGALVQHVTAAATSLVLGRALDLDPQAYRWIFPIVGVFGFLYLLILSRLPKSDEPTAAGALPLDLLAPFRQAIRMFRRDPAFFWYEMNFMLYGAAYMMMLPVVPLFFTEQLDLSYEQISNARILIASLGVALLGPLMGRLMDDLHPARLCVLSFTVLAGYPLVLALVGTTEALPPVAFAYGSFVMYSLGMSGVNITWNVGSISFAPKGEGGYYQGIHVAMVGLRGVFGPLLGYAVLRFLGYREVFVAAVLLYLASAVSSYGLWRRIVKIKRLS